MWMLLAHRRPPEQEASEVAETNDRSSPAGNGAGPATFVWVNANGDDSFVPAVALAGGELLGLRVYLHPGRGDLGEMEARRVGQQFDMRAAPLFASVAEAELAADDRAGFLVEIDEPFVDPEGREHESGVFFVERLR